MKTRNTIASVAAAALLMLGLSSCDKNPLKVNLPMEFATITFEIPVTPIAGPYVDSAEVTTNIDSLLSANKVKASNIKSIKIESLTFTCPEGDTLNNFRLVESVKGDISKDSDSPVTVSELNNNPNAASYFINMPVNTGTEYKNYLTGSTFKFKVTGNTRGPVTAPIIVTAKLKFNVEAGL
ncbi:MAG TPA: hypothetical protein VFV37_06135 [Luteibaculaceae bacterium]|nr:hypothetical protein [Luteibaculaceae bacterium]